MLGKLAGILALCGLVCVGQNREDEFQKSVMPVLSARCTGCHNSRLKIGNLNLEQFRDGHPAVAQPEVWKKVRDRIAAGTMPPAPTAAPPAAERAAVIGWIDGLLGRAESAVVDPGRVTARRLNRTEYNNTIRDLLGVTIRAADEFPIDDSGYGFDNIGDVLSVSPLLMEKLMSAAQRISRVAVYGEAHSPEPSLLVKIKPKKSQDDGVA